MQLVDLPHDTARRFAALVAIARRLELPDRARALDVGGYPGMLGRILRAYLPDWHVQTIDRVPAELPDYQCGDGARLPFEDGSFDIVFSSDTFEHVPADARKAFIDEAARVSRGPVVIGAPFSHRAVIEIERQLSTTYEALTGKPHPWLWEHASFGLPSLEDTIGLFPASRPVALVRSAPLDSWAMWQWASIAREAAGELEPAWKQYDGSLVTEEAGHLARGEASADYAFPDGGAAAGFLPYRWILVSQPVDRVRIPLHTGAVRCDESRVASVVEQSALMAAVVGHLVRTSRSGVESPIARIDERLRQALQGSESEAGRLRAEVDRLRAEVETLKRPRGLRALLGGS